ncbi:MULTISPECIES: hypothetical protein [Pseudomonas]|uniref:Uncharacterized protein n=1 Tax=Pseudomonas luteola TaxID=47886 RepID=A0ABS0MVY8_PSELU|nr:MULTISPECIES: hypothetical protein [Pseudomonas]MBA1250136.1 hypothetical protein [Pseudomonas zeshuii]MBH3440886.1 hypothetical protein [Pseudomonas luteola]
MFAEASQFHARLLPRALVMASTAIRRAFTRRSSFMPTADKTNPAVKATRDQTDIAVSLEANMTMAIMYKTPHNIAASPTATIARHTFSPLLNRFEIIAMCTFLTL